ncbi:MAG: hypothetical protein AAB469_00130 [Patescibacteria group bacterium]
MEGIEKFVVTLSLILIFVFIFLAFLFLGKAKKIKSKIEEPQKREDGAEALFKRFNENWQGVLVHINTSNESDWKLAIMEADKIVDEILILKGYKGESMAERLTSIGKNELKSLELLWEAHKVRNRIAHQPGYGVDYNQARKIISYYEEVLKDLRAL